MATRAELEQRLHQLPQPPFFAELVNHRAHLSMYDRQQSPFVCPRGATKVLFVATELVLDRCLEQPGLWVRAVDTTYAYFPDGPKLAVGRDIWLNLEWCVVYEATTGTPFSPN